ncbi:cob(I)yrinic acid a,c-diamide adenosyltransferase [Ferrimonas sp. YFM]|uniref:cob(I)yrinic acid a,c-diamide adenosyltransferase n=1 Tax=Ferrimonas sp. YFM TaxID=3028878 RepID=UPI002572F342|nr:cob(I)yrinic acid a,c-diamide adenosyltransferase [Ferrimonas sp. YFM]BDY03712.1 cob(I)yrinic acid a,c-diamide adenosyltransferase [Ferrimonas sp. YFM]
MTDTNQRHKERQQKVKEKVDAKVAQAQEERGVVLILTGNGKGKSTAGFGTVARAVGHGQNCAVAQFIKGNWACGERDLLAGHGVRFHVMATGFTWETQDKEADTAAAQEVWQQIKQELADPKVDLVLLDEITYMTNYGYLDLDEVIQAIADRPREQSVVITGRAAHRRLEELADTVSEVRPLKHAFEAGIKARKGVDW